VREATAMNPGQWSNRPNLLPEPVSFLSSVSSLAA
jgi:hypothetical protein